ncbi:Cap15 family cyclic dinucleotide receptor domain-containing protein [Tenacibaculum agarivorans]|uniref:Cap15 family cyclic dinucleotide receptor domain-containing protein n=1 Tax=Tenacibaculum agarivorans TaxID=1908389 RepID=UPI000A87E184|nr:hypothetical protein [Tenacibaculum agarivorans]
MKTNYFTYYQPWAVVLVVGSTLLGIIWAQQFNWSYPIIGIGLLGIVLKIIDQWLWKYPPFSWLFTIKDFSGTYTGTQECFIIEKEENCKTNKIYIDVTMVIVQTGSTITVNAFYKRHNKKSSNSHSNLCMITRTEDKQHFKILYQYTNEGNEELDTHFGTCIIKVKDNNGNYLLEGTYYTNRKPYPTKGNFQNLTRTSTKTTHPF